MKTKILFYILVSFLFCFANVLLAQEVSEWEQNVINENYFGNEDYWRANQLVGDRKIEDSRTFYIAAIEKFEQEKNWQAYIKSNIDFLKIYQGTSDFQIGIQIGEDAFKKIKSEALQLRKTCSQLVYQTGLTYPYPYKNKAAVEKFAYAKNLVKNQSPLDTIFLSQIYNSMGQGILHLGYYESAEYYLLQSKKLLESHPSFQNCEQAWEQFYGEPQTTTIIQENGDTMYAVTGGGLGINIDVDCQNYLHALATTYHHLGNFYRVKCEYEKSIEYLELGLEKVTAAFLRYEDEYFIEHYYQLGRYYFDLEEYEQSNIYLKKIIDMIEGMSALGNSFKEEPWKRSYLIDQVLPDCYYHIGTNYFRQEEYENSASYFEEDLVLVESDSTQFDIKVKTLLGLHKLVWHQNKYLMIGDSIVKDFISYVDNTVLTNRPIAEFEMISTETIVKYNSAKAAHLMWDFYDKDSTIYYYKIADAIALLKESLKRLPSDEMLPLRVETNLDLAGKYYTYAVQDSTVSVDSALYYAHQALIDVSNNFDTLDVFQLPAVEDLKDLAIVQKVLLEKVSLLLEHFSPPITPAGKQELQDFLRTNTIVEGSPYFEEFNLLKKTFKFLNEIILLADDYQSKQLEKSSFLRAGNHKFLANESIELYHDGIFIAYFYNLLTGTDEMLEEAFYYTQKMKGQKLVLARLKNEALYQTKIDAQLLEEERNLKLKIAEYENSIFEIKNKNNFNERNTDNIEFTRLFKTKRDLRQLQKKIDIAYPEYLQSKYTFTPETYSSIQELLEEDEILIEYVMTCCELFTIVISKNEPPQIIDSAGDDNAAYYIMQLKTMLENSSMMRKSTREKFIEMNHSLYELLLKPIENKIANKKRLIIIADEYAHYVPFEMLLKSKEIKPYHQLDYLIEDYEVSYHYSSSLFARARRKKIESIPSVYAFAPVYDDGNKALAEVETSTKSKDGMTFRAFDENGTFSSLPESENEVKAIIKLFSEKTNSSNNTLALREDANEAALKKHLEQPYQFVHIAGHSFANFKEPDFSGIACYKSDRRIGEDGTLYTSEIYNLMTKADLVTLSSCESGGGKLDESDGLLGLNRAFIYAGTSNVVFSLWKVYDKVNAQLMVDFYDNILSGKNYSTSLRNAKLNLLKNEMTASPHFWSPYLLIGR